jgi:hypothetical protein
LCAFCEQKEEAKLVSDMETMTARAREENAIQRDELVTYLNEIYVHRQQINEMAKLQVGKSGFSHSQN